MEWIKTAERDDGVQTWTAVDYVQGEQAYDESGTPVGDPPYVPVPITPAKVDKRLMDAVWEGAKELTQKLDQLEYVQVGTSGVALRFHP